MNTLQYIRSGDGTLCIFVSGKNFTVAPDLIAYSEILKGLEAETLDESTLVRLTDTQKAVAAVAQSVSAGKVQVDLNAGKVWYDGVEFPDKALCDRILKLMADGHPFQFMVNFLEKLGRNPNFRSVMELFHFISVQGFPITPEGNILAYKGINEDWTDCHTGKIDNSVGALIPRRDRKDCDENWRQACSTGYHVGTFDYAKSFGKKLVLVEIDPADVIAVPGGNVWKMRCCFYKVIADHTNLTMLTGSVYDSTGKEVPASTYGQFDNACASHWDEDEGRTYDAQDREDDEDDDEWDDDDEDDEDDLDDGAWDDDGDDYEDDDE